MYANRGRPKAVNEQYLARLKELESANFNLDQKTIQLRNIPQINTISAL
ncbi:hypothetical protein [Dulcicalothrix desertica]|nr:hypothetical protein [Dulcicalothrix desertica]